MKKDEGVGLDIMSNEAPKAMAVRTGETAVSAVAALAEANVKARYAMALRRPRDLDEVREKILKECRRPGFAEAAIYFKPIGKGITGPSIRFVEAAIRCMTNMLTETTVVFDDPSKRILKVAVTDLETNSTYEAEVTVNKTVERSKVTECDTVLKKRINSKGFMTYTIEATDDDILNKQNKIVSQTIRTLGLRHIPGDITDEGKALCMKVKADHDAKDPESARKKLFDLFREIGISAPQVKLFLGHDGKVLNDKERLELRGLYNTIKDGEMSWAQALEEKVKKKGDKSDNGNDKSGVLRTRVEGDPEPKEEDIPIEEEPVVEEEQETSSYPGADS